MIPLLLAALLQLQLPAPTGYVNDLANVVRPEQVAAMLRVIDEVRQKSGGEIVVVTLRDIGGRAAIEVARDIGRQWKVGAQGGAGDSARNAGVVLLLVPGERPGDGKAEVAIGTGTGAEGFITDAYAGRVRDAIGRAATQEGSYGAGLVAGVAMLGVAYAREYSFELTGAPKVQAPTGRPGGRFPFGLVLLVIIVLISSRRGGGGGLASALFWGSLLGGGRGGGGGGFGGGGGAGGGGGSRPAAAAATNDDPWGSAPASGSFGGSDDEPPF
jgi:uncharacterized protein